MADENNVEQEVTKPSKRKKQIIISSILSVVLVVALIIVFISLGSDDKVNGDLRSDKSHSSKSSKSSKTSDSKITGSTTITTDATGNTIITDSKGSIITTTTAKGATTTTGAHSGSTGSSGSGSSGGSGTTATTAAGFTGDNFAGHWYDNSGDVTFSQSGANVTGSWNYVGIPINLTGTVSGHVLSGTYSFLGNTSAYSITKSGSTFNGSWGTGYKWCGAKDGVTFPDNCGFNRTWQTYAYGTYGDPTYFQVVLTQVNNTVTGTAYNLHYLPINGTVSYSGSFVVLTGTWTQGVPINIKFYLAQQTNSAPSQTTFRGNYGNTSDTSWGWCGADAVGSIAPVGSCKK